MQQAGGNDGGAGRLKRAWSCEKRRALWQSKFCCDAFMDVPAERHLHVHRDSAGGALGSERALSRLSEPGAHGHHRQCPAAASAGLRVCAPPLAPGPQLCWPHPPTAPPAPSVGNAGARARASTRAARTGAAPASPQCACECILYTDCRGGIAGPSDRTRRHGSCLT